MNKLSLAKLSCRLLLAVVPVGTALAFYFLLFASGIPHNEPYSAVVGMAFGLVISLIARRVWAFGIRSIEAIEDKELHASLRYLPVSK